MTGEGAGLRGFKQNGPPDGWVETNGPVWWVGSDRAYLTPGGRPAGLSAVTRATNIIVNPIATAEWTVGGDVPRWISDPTLLRPDDRVGPSALPATARVPRSTFWATWIRSAISWGMGYLAFAESADGSPQPGTMMLLRPDMVDPAPHGAWDGTANARRIQLPGGRHVDTDRDGRFDGMRLVELRNVGTPLDPLTGVTPGTLAHHAAELGLMDAQLSYAAGMYSGGGVPSGYLKVSSPQALTSEGAEALRSRWDAAHGSGARRTAVLSSAVDYQAIAVSPVDAALAEMKRLSLVDVANAYGIPGYMIGAPGTSMTYSNVEMELQALYEFTLLPWAAAVEETLGALLPAGTALRITPAGEGRVPGGGRPAEPAAGGGGTADVPSG